MMAVAACVCDKDGVLLYQNARSVMRDGDVVETGESNTYAIIRHGKKRLLHQTPWYEVPGGEVSGLIELSVDIPDEYPTFDRDAYSH